MIRSEIVELVAKMIGAKDLHENMELSMLDAWDSMANISLIALADDHFSKKVEISDLRNLKTVKDIVDFLSK